VDTSFIRQQRSRDRSRDEAARKTEADRDRSRDEAARKTEADKKGKRIVGG
jgi:hypothetical protein